MMFKKRLLLLYLILSFIALRPLIDFFPQLQKGLPINAGGVWGLGLTGLVACFLSWVNLRKDRILLLCIVPLFLIVVFYTGHLILTFERGVLVSFARFVVGFSPFFLLLIPFQKVLKDRHQETFRLFYWILLFSLIPAFIIVFLQFFETWEGFYGLYAGQQRATGGYEHPGNLGRYVVFFIILSYLGFKKGLISPRVVYPVLGLSWLVLFLTGHRTSLTVGSLIVLVFEFSRFVIWFKHKLVFISRRNILIVGLMILLVLLGSLFFVWLSNPVVERELEAQFQQNLRSFREIPMQIYLNDQWFSDSFLNNRGGIWRETINFMNEQSFAIRVFGYGQTVLDAHNEFLHRYLNSGFLGVFLLYGWFFPLLFIWMIRPRNKLIIIFSVLLYSVYFASSIPLRLTIAPNYLWLFFVTCFFIVTVVSSQGEHELSRVKN